MELAMTGRPSSETSPAPPVNKQTAADAITTLFIIVFSYPTNGILVSKQHFAA